MRRYWRSPKAEIYEDIMKMPEGFDTYVGERGAPLPAAETTHLNCADFPQNPPILILDEATSALDSVTEAHIQQAFDELAVGRTTLIIAHRLATIRNADRVVVVEDGRIEEEGTQTGAFGARRGIRHAVSGADALYVGDGG